jgi:hypothetical protein
MTSKVAHLRRAPRNRVWNVWTQVGTVALTSCLVLTACMHPRSSLPGPIRYTEYVLESVADRVQKHLELWGTIPEDLSALCRDERDCSMTLQDAWQTPVVYQRLAESDYELRSLGADRREATEDDITYSPGRELQIVRSVTGCYRLGQELRWFPGHEVLFLDTVRIAVRRYRAAPTIGSYGGPFWHPRRSDSVVVSWLGAERSGPVLRLAVVDTGLVGAAFEGFRRKGVSAKRAPCNLSDPVPQDSRTPLRNY